jgi:hypothetical protein
LTDFYAVNPARSSANAGVAGIPGVTPIQQKETLEADSIPYGPAFRGKSVSQSDLANNSALIEAGLYWVKLVQIGSNTGFKGY